MLVSQTPIVEGDARYKVTRFVKDGKPVFMDSRSRRGNHEVFLVEDGDELFYARYRSFKGKGRLVPPDEEAVCTTSGVEHGSPEIEGFFKKLKNPLL